MPTKWKKRLRQVILWLCWWRLLPDLCPLRNTHTYTRRIIIVFFLCFCNFNACLLHSHPLQPFTWSASDVLVSTIYCSLCLKQLHKDSQFIKWRITECYLTSGRQKNGNLSLTVLRPRSDCHNTLTEAVMLMSALFSLGYLHQVSTLNKFSQIAREMYYLLENTYGNTSVRYIFFKQ
jgi:hypothetical protein